MAWPSSVPAEALAGFPALTGSLLEGRYRVGEALGVGGMGAVFEAEHIRLGRKVALKVMRPLYMQYRHHVARFMQEARAASQVKHPNVVEILDVGETPEGTVYTVMELLDGEDLATILRREERLSWPRVHDILVQVVAALEAAHEQGVIHRDVKPANCILVRGKHGEPVVKMVDFGIAKFHDDRFMDGDDPLTKTGEVIGTPAYMAPELALGKAANARTDVYSVGVLAYQMLTGERPFGGATAVEMHLNQTTRPPVAPRQREPSIPSPVEALILQMLAANPEERPLDMARVAHELRVLAPRARNTLPMAPELSRLRASMPALPPRLPHPTPGEPSGRAGPVGDGALRPANVAAPHPPEAPSDLADWDDIETQLVETAQDPGDRSDVGHLRVDAGPVRMVAPEEVLRALEAPSLRTRSRGELFKTIPVDPETFRRSLQAPSPAQGLPGPAQAQPVPAHLPGPGQAQPVPAPLPGPQGPGQVQPMPAPLSGPMQPRPGPAVRIKQTLAMGSAGLEPGGIEPHASRAHDVEIVGDGSGARWSGSTVRVPVSASDPAWPAGPSTGVGPRVAPPGTRLWPAVLIVGLVVAAAAGAAYGWWPQLRALLGG
ncbi:MAG: protein kinase [Myxococcales bacterium]|nr:protein kinase [Myxococcales bacterium]